MIINTRNYADFVLASKTLRHRDAVFYNNAITIQGSGPYAVAYAFDYAAGVCVVSQEANGTALSLTDFPGAVALSNEIQISAASTFASGI